MKKFVTAFPKEKKLCNKHPKYKAIRRPRSSCNACWQAYLEAEKARLRAKMEAAK